MNELQKRLKELEEWERQCETNPYLKPHLPYVKRQIAEVKGLIRKEKIAGLL